MLHSIISAGETRHPPTKKKKKKPVFKTLLGIYDPATPF